MMDTELDLRRHDLLIDGKRVPPSSGEYSVDINPATEEPIALVAQGSAADVDVAVRAARAALNVWNALRAAERGRILIRFAELLRTHQDELATLESLDAGKPIAAVQRQDIPAIVPWNFPLMIGMWKIAPALACGCTMIVKPAEITPLTALRVGELALEAGVPPGVLNIVTGKGRVVGDALVAHPGVDKVTFTGSPSVGRGILQGAAVNFKRVTLELGGKSANVIFPDANLDSAVRAAASGIFFNTGQVCSAGSRILAHRDVYDEVVERLAARAKSIKVGDPAVRETSMGPVVSAAQMKTVLDYVEIGREEGATLVTGGARLGKRGFFVEPTVFANVEHEMRISQEEIFGPVASVIRFEDEADAIRIANGTLYSLAAGVWSADIGRVHRVAHALRAGTVWINTYGYTDVRLPWGGAGDSGFGREHGDVAIENFTEPKAVWLSIDQ
jgi:acyl-CoA reductase-like NAD-dependent aldehyde dehydrogenase